MPRKPSFPELNDLTEPGSTVVFRTYVDHKRVLRVAGQYAKRHGFAVDLDLQDEPKDVREAQGALYVAVRR